MSAIEVGDTVLIPAEVIEIEDGNPHGTYTVYMEYASNYFYEDGITVIVPQPVATLQEEEETA